MVDRTWTMTPKAKAALIDVLARLEGLTAKERADVQWGRVVRERWALHRGLHSRAAAAGGRPCRLTATAG